jgi:glyoxylase-like metal-dependent hydrolase (beta-lactamase superfamily II)
VPIAEKWFDGLHLIGQFNRFQTGCWLLEHGGEGAILEMPPAGLRAPSVATAAAAAVAALAIGTVKYLFCTHAHWDHCSRKTYRQLRAAFPTAQAYLHSGFRGQLGEQEGVHYFAEKVKLDLAGEPLFLVHAPKHSNTDTMVIFRGTACTGDWELGTIRSVHDWNPLWAVPRDEKLQAIARMERFTI